MGGERVGGDELVCDHVIRVGPLANAASAPPRFLVLLGEGHWNSGARPPALLEIWGFAPYDL